MGRGQLVETRAHEKKFQGSNLRLAGGAYESSIRGYLLLQFLSSFFFFFIFFFTINRSTGEEVGSVRAKEPTRIIQERPLTLQLRHAEDLTLEATDRVKYTVSVLLR